VESGDDVARVRGSQAIAGKDATVVAIHLASVDPHWRVSGLRARIRFSHPWATHQSQALNQFLPEDTSMDSNLKTKALIVLVRMTVVYKGLTTAIGRTFTAQMTECRLTAGCSGRSAARPAAEPERSADFTGAVS
jgi:hypothetical protein